MCPQLLWCLAQLLMFFGISEICDYDNSNDVELLWLYLFGLIIYIFCSYLFSFTYKSKSQISTETNPDNYRNRQSILWILMLLAIVLSTYFFVKGGGNVFVEGVKSIIFGSEYSVKYSRMNLLSISGVGYIYQLRVTVLPLCVLYYYFYNKKNIITPFLIVATILFLVGTGQRGGLVSAVVITILTYYYWTRDNTAFSVQKKIRVYIFVILVTVVLFGLSTVMNGRVSEEGTIFSAILQRFITDNQSSALYGFRYIKMEDIQYGRDWLFQLKDILPGKNTYMSLDTRIFAFIHGGSTNGTSPPCIWGSAYYNFGYVGIVVMALFASFLTSTIHKVFIEKKCDEFGIITYAACQFLAAYWVAGGPVVLFNNGFITVILLYWIMKLATKYRIIIRY